LKKNLRPYISTEPLMVEAVECSQFLNKTPLYITSLSAIKDRLNAYQETISQYFSQYHIHYAMKANSALPLLQHLCQWGSSIEIVSVGELNRALTAGFHPTDIAFSGVGKTQKEIDKALEVEVGYIHAEHMEELWYLLDHAQDKSSCITIRLNPSAEVETHPYLKTGALDSKFGILFEHIQKGFQHKLSHLSLSEKHKYLIPIRGIHIHLGSQLQNPNVYEYVMEECRKLYDFLKSEGAVITHINLGGGLEVKETGVPHDHSDIKNYIEFLSKIFKKYFSEEITLHLEPGRSLVASSSILLTKVLYKKENDAQHKFIYVDAGMNDFPRPSLYHAKHAYVLIPSDPTQMSDKETNYSIVGPVCESGDVLHPKAHLKDSVCPGDSIIFLDVGAYCRSMASFYNLRPIPSEVFCYQGKLLSSLPAHYAAENE